MIAHAKPPRGEPGWCACDPFSATAEAEALTPEAITCPLCAALFAQGLARVGGGGWYPERSLPPPSKTGPTAEERRAEYERRLTDVPWHPKLLRAEWPR